MYYVMHELLCIVECTFSLMPRSKRTTENISKPAGLRKELHNQCQKVRCQSISLPSLGRPKTEVVREQKSKNRKRIMNETLWD